MKSVSFELFLSFLNEELLLEWDKKSSKQEIYNTLKNKHPDWNEGRLYAVSSSIFEKNQTSLKAENERLQAIRAKKEEEAKQKAEAEKYAGTQMEIDFSADPNKKEKD